MKAVWPDFIMGEHFRIMSEAFDRVAAGTLRRLIICMPPRHGKSRSASVHLPAWFFGKYPNKKVIQCSCTAELAVGFGRDVRDLVLSDDYAKIFPDLELKADSKAAGRWSTNKGGEYFAIGTGGSVTGRGGDLVVIDDPHSTVVSTEIPTPSGFTTIGALAVGDEVFGPDGLPTKVVAKSPVYKDRPIYEAIRGDGTIVECDGGHLWSVSATDGSFNGVMKTRDMVSVEKTLHLPKLDPVEYPEQLLPIPPYTLGAWLGDGTSSLGRISGVGDDLAFVREQIGLDGYATTDLKDKMAFGVLGIREQLIEHGLLNNKHIPAPYLTASVEQRMALLQGLMDTDGTVNNNGRCIFNNCNKKLMDGNKPDTRDRYKKPRQLDYRICFTLNGSARMPRKRIYTHDLLRSNRSVKVMATTRRGDVQCITVDREDGLFVIGRGYMVTHNSEQEAKLAEHQPEIYDGVYEWYTSGPRQRLQPGGSLVIVNTRWSKRDLVGRILDAQANKEGVDQWEVIEFPAILPSGKQLWPEYWPIEELEATRSELSVVKWQAQYQQDPPAPRPR
jgi:hypothetical protein